LINSFNLVITLIGIQVVLTLSARLNRTRLRERPVCRVLIYGADEFGVSMLSGIRAFCPKLQAVGFVDGDPLKTGTTAAGLRVLGSRSDLRDVVERYRIDELLIPSGSSDEHLEASLRQMCEATSTRVRRLPWMQQEPEEASHSFSAKAGQATTTPHTQHPKVLVVGPASGKGGIARVIELHRQTDAWKGARCTLLSTWDDHNFLAKICAAMRAYALAPFLLTRANLVHIHLAGNRSVLRKLPIIVMARVFGVPVIAHVHAFSVQSLLDQTPLHAGRLALKMASCTVALSATWAADLRRRLPTIPIVELANPVRMPRERQWAARDPLILFVGKLEARKGFRDLLAAVPSVLRDFPRARFTLAGHGDLAGAAQLAQELGISEQVSMTGWVSGCDLETLYASATVFCLPSFDEGQPMSTLEAMSFGVPVVCTPVGGVVDLVQHGKNGLLIEPGQPGWIANAILELLRDPALCRKLGTAARQTVMERHSLEVVSRELSSLYRELVSRPEVTEAVGEQKAVLASSAAPANLRGSQDFPTSHAGGTT
jgi:glycosyltransferase involved in cell wall biosynthesis